MIDLAAIVHKIDECFAQNNGEEAEKLMREGITRAVTEQDDNSLLTLLNELIGYYRETSRVEESFVLADQAKGLLKRLALEGTIPFATTYLNIANAYRAGGRLQDSLECYRVTESIYGEILDPRDMLAASLQNNVSLLYQEMGDFEKAEECLKKALSIVEENPEAYFETAVTCTNLAATCLNGDKDDEAAGYFKRAIAIFEGHGIEDAHYSAALSALGTYYYKAGDYADAAMNYRKAMDCMSRSLGKNEYYHRLEENLRVCERILAGADNVSGRMAGENPFESGKTTVSAGPAMSGLELSRAYYETFGRPMIHEKFPEYESRIAVGLAGEGSDCFGFDDSISRDHDWGPDFCMWVTSETYEEIGLRLQEEYEKLPSEFMGYSRTVSRQGKGRRGVQVIEDFFGRLLGTDNCQILLASSVRVGEPDTPGCSGAGKMAAWQQVSDSGLAACVNGEVFRDDEGVFSGIRVFLEKGWPEPVLYLKLAQGAAAFSQSGQYNYGRAVSRKDKVTARIMLADCMREAMKLFFYMENKFPPHDKWLFKKLEGGSAESREFCRLLKKLEEEPWGIGGGQTEGYLAEDEVSENGLEGTGRKAAGLAEERSAAAGLIEDIAGYLARKLYEKGYISDTDSYLDVHTEELLVKSALAGKGDAELAEKITELEFRAFDQVRNQGGRASCQDDWHTFHIMRMSQYQTWSHIMLMQYLYDFQREMDRGHNLIEEKYGRMMESTAPGEYEKIKGHFPVLNEEKKAIIEAVVQIQVGWMEEFEQEYPLLAGNARSVRTADDSLYNTSYETYLRGEISTYSDKMLELYGRYVAECAGRGGNLTYEIMTNSVHMYGYQGLRDAEEQSGKAE